MARQMFNVVVGYPLGKEVAIAEVKSYLEQVLCGKIDKYVAFTSSSHERYLSGPAIVGHLIIDHSHMIDTETMRGYLSEEHPPFKTIQVGKL